MVVGVDVVMVRSGKGDNMRGIEGAGALMLIDTMITIQGLEKTLEQIRSINKINPYFSKRMSASEKKEILEAWEGLLAYAVRANKRARVR